MLAGDNEIPSNLQQATGPEREEMIAELEGRDMWDYQLSGPFGTKDKPVVVESVFSERIVGCPGDCNGSCCFAILIGTAGETSNNNEVSWFIVKETEPYSCKTCGQVFVLKRKHVQGGHGHH